MRGLGGPSLATFSELTTRPILPPWRRTYGRKPHAQEESYRSAHSGTGNAYSDGILNAAQLSAVTLTHKLEPRQCERLFAGTHHTLGFWIERLCAEAEAGFTANLVTPMGVGEVKQIPQAS